MQFVSDLKESEHMRAKARPGILPVVKARDPNTQERCVNIEIITRSYIPAGTKLSRVRDLVSLLSGVAPSQTVHPRGGESSQEGARKLGNTHKRGHQVLQLFRGRDGVALPLSLWVPESDQQMTGSSPRQAKRLGCAQLLGSPGAATLHRAPATPGTRRSWSHPGPASLASQAAVRRISPQVRWEGAAPPGAASAVSAVPRQQSLFGSLRHGAGRRAAPFSEAVRSLGWRCLPTAPRHLSAPDPGPPEPGDTGAPSESRLGRKTGSGMAVGSGG
ncbi:hypothetical protein NDU88_003362 [Pleurodeles waltl]|uniref:Uncharacterized protein n=1 Tax=Pleurodeles waltl TaxID=8319 RepID=A0AAV7UE20_PLEWA|nr:hypothetical protein NDU88_003362 [Pleurodeles waltl]